MSGIIIEPVTTIDSMNRNFSRLNEAIVALQGGSIAIENIEGYENLATKLYVEEEIETVRYAVGDVHISESEENPKDKFGYGEWQFISKGRTLVGIDTMPEEGDPDYDPEYEVDQDFQTPGQEGGEKEHTLTVEELPPHKHDQTTQLPDWDFGEAPPRDKVVGGRRTDSNLSDDTAAPTREAGDGEPHNNLQPYYCVYIWKRTA